AVAHGAAARGSPRRAAEAVVLGSRRPDPATAGPMGPGAGLAALQDRTRRSPCPRSDRPHLGWYAAVLICHRRARPRHPLEWRCRISVCKPRPGAYNSRFAPRGRDGPSIQGVFMSNAVNRQRGVEHDIVQPAQAADSAPYYEPQGNEIAVFEAAARRKLPVMLKGPTGCGKTRFLEHMAWRLKRPLVTVSCHEDLTSSDLVGRFLLEGAETVWQDGPLTRAVKAGAICYLDEIVEARTDSTVVIHSLTDHRR